MSENIQGTTADDTLATEAQRINTEFSTDSTVIVTLTGTKVKVGFAGQVMKAADSLFEAVKHIVKEKL